MKSCRLDRWGYDDLTNIIIIIVILLGYFNQDLKHNFSNWKCGIYTN